MQCADGEIKAARAAEKFGVPFTLSTMSICSIEDVAENTTAPFWFSLYNAGHGICIAPDPTGEGREMFGLVITLDLQILGQRHKDLKNGLSAPPKPTLKNMINLSTKWGWGLEFENQTPLFWQYRWPCGRCVDPASLMDWTAQQFDPLWIGTKSNKSKTNGAAK